MPNAILKGKLLPNTVEMLSTIQEQAMTMVSNTHEPAVTMFSSIHEPAVTMLSTLHEPPIRHFPAPSCPLWFCLQSNQPLWWNHVKGHCLQPCAHPLAISSYSKSSSKSLGGCTSNLLFTLQTIKSPSPQSLQSSSVFSHWLKLTDSVQCLVVVIDFWFHAKNWHGSQKKWLINIWFWSFIL